jgi:archaellum component FlaF (FlaF/FlaG flagellin family)
MDKKSKNYIVISAAFVAGILIAVYFYYYKPLKKANLLKDKEIEDLNELVSHYNDFDKDIAEQITSALSFINIGNTLEGIRKLAVLAENLLEKLYLNNDSCRKWLKAKGKPFNAGNMLLYCKEEDKKITNSEYGALFFLKEIRNEESHKINVKLEEFIEKSGLTVAVGSIKILSILCYPPIEGDS